MLECGEIWKRGMSYGANADLLASRLVILITGGVHAGKSLIDRNSLETSLPN